MAGTDPADMSPERRSRLPGGSHRSVRDQLIAALKVDRTPGRWTAVKAVNFEDEV